MSIKPENRLKPWVIDFLHHYINDPTNNASRAVRLVKPHLKPKSATDCGTKLLANAIVRKELERLRAEAYFRGISRREYLAKIAGEIAENEENKPNERLKAVDQIAKLAHLYNKEESDEAKFKKFIQSLGDAKVAPVKSIDCNVRHENTAPESDAAIMPQDDK